MNSNRRNHSLPNLAAGIAAAPANPLRRRLLLGVPGSLALVSPLGLLGCGGGGGGADAGAGAAADDPEAAEVRAVVARLPAFTREARAVQVQLPAGAGVALDKTQLVTANNVSQVAADGTAGAVLLGGAPQMAYLFDAAGRLLLMGIIEPGASTRLDARSTAEALILLASEVALAGDVAELALREALRSHPAVLPVQQAVEAAAARGGIDDADTALNQAVEDVLRTLRRLPARGQAAPGRARALGVQPLPATALSGITAKAGADYNTVVLTNAFRRRAHAWVSRIGYFDASGNPVQLPAPLPVKDFALKPTTALSFDNLVIAVGDLAAELAEDLGLIDPYQSGNAFWSPVSSAPLALPLEPTAAQVAVYQARVVGVGARDGEPMRDAEAAKLEELMGETLWEDIILPLVKTVILPLISNRVSAAYKAEFKNQVNAMLLAATVDLAKIEVSGKFFPETVQALRQGRADALLDAFWKEFFSSGVFKRLLETALKATIAATPIDVLPAIRDGSGNLLGVNLLPEADLVKANVDKLSAALTKLSRHVMAVKAALTVGDYAAMAKDWLASSRVESFDLNVSKARIALDPNPAVAAALAGDAGKVAVTATVQDLDGLFNTANVFLEWKCTGRNGNLFRRGGAGTNEFESPLSNRTHDYFPNGDAQIGPNADTISVKAFYRNPTTNQRIEMGSVSVPVNIRKEFTLKFNLAPDTEVPTDTPLPVSAMVQPSLPAGATVDWTWSHSGTGTLEVQAPDTVPSDSAAILRTGTSEGAAVLKVRATIHAPATATLPARSVQAEEISLPLRVKAGVRTLTFEASGGAFACTDTRACGVSYYGAYLVPVLPKARSYSATFSGFGYGPCNHTRTWTGPVGDGGGCRFPISYHPHNSNGPTNTWAVWLGFTDTWAPDGKCVVTITLDP